MAPNDGRIALRMAIAVVGCSAILLAGAAASAPPGAASGDKAELKRLQGVLARLHSENAELRAKVKRQPPRSVSRLLPLLDECRATTQKLEAQVKALQSQVKKQKPKTGEEPLGWIVEGDLEWSGVVQEMSKDGGVTIVLSNTGQADQMVISAGMREGTDLTGITIGTRIRLKGETLSFGYMPESIFERERFELRLKDASIMWRQK